MLELREINGKVNLCIGGKKMDTLGSFLNQNVGVEISGSKILNGKLLDVGSDIIVLFNGKDYLYVSFMHIQHFWLNEDDVEVYEENGAKPFNTTTSVRSVLSNAKGLFVEIHVIGKQSVHGYITGVQSDYIIFYSPVFKTMYIPLHHLKWLIPYQSSKTPYALENKMLPVNPSNISVARSFEVQLQKLIGKLVVFDLGLSEHRIGLLKKIESKFIHLVSARGEIILVNLQHVKSVHFD